MAMDPNDKYITGMVLPSVAKVLGIEYQAACYLVRKKKVDAIKVGDIWLVDPESVKRYEKFLDAKRMVQQHTGI